VTKDDSAPGYLRPRFPTPNYDLIVGDVACTRARGVAVGNLIRVAREANRAMLLPYERSLQHGLVGAGLIVPVAGLIGS
jgi:hypothetical protein